MPQSVDVGSVLGGRYKVTAQVLASAEQDLVLDGVDQVLNRSVSILVAAPVNASQVSASAREIATGERHGNVQVLDLGVSDGRTYLVTNNANAADLLDLVIERDAPYVEPFFTDTLGSEIFGMPRSNEPETVEDDRYVEERTPRRPLIQGTHRPKLPKFGRGAAAGALAGSAAERDLEFGEAEDAPAEAATGGANVPPVPTTAPKSSSATARTPKVTKWEEDEPAAEAPERERDVRSASNFPKSALAAGNYDSDYEYGAHGSGTEPEEDYDDDDGKGRSRKSGRVVIGAVLSLILVLAVVLTVTQLGKLGELFGSDPQAEASVEASTEAAPAPVESEAAPAAAPEIAGISRLVPENPQLDSANDGALPQMIDGNPSSYWSSYVYASDTFGGLAPSLALVVDLGTDSAVSEVKITQLNGTGGSFSVLLNDTPDLEGARTVAQSGFTGPTTSIPVPEADGSAATARYVIVNFTQLPRLNSVQAAYPWGLRIAEISVS